MVKYRGVIVKLVLMILAVVLALAASSGCRSLFYIPGASYGYYIWEEGDSIHVEWSIDRKDSKFSGRVSTDGRIVDYSLEDWEESDEVTTRKENDIEFEASLSRHDFSDAIILTFEDHTYINFNLKINDGHDLTKINIGAPLENPVEPGFRIQKDYFKELARRPWYKMHPFSEFFYKLYMNKLFTFIYIFILGTVLIGIFRITAFKNKKIYIFLPAAYLVLAVIEISIYYLLRFMVN